MIPSAAIDQAVPTALNCATTIGPASPTVIVSGLVWLMLRQAADRMVPDEALSGPAVGAALGAVAAGNRPELLVALPEAVPELALRLIHRLDPAGKLLRYRRQAVLRWSAPAVLDDTRRWQLDGDARGWVAEAAPVLLDGRVLVLANANPKAYATMLRDARPRFTAMDLDAAWAPSQPAALKACLRRVQLVTITRAHQRSLPPDLFAGCGAGQRGGPILVIKAGADGVRILADGDSMVLPAPSCGNPVKTDIGAGDLLLGLLASRLGLLPTPVTLNDSVAAYRQSMPVIATLLQSESFLDFAETVLEDLP